MKVLVILFLIAFAAVECRKLVQIDKKANVDFINMEMGGTRPSGGAASRPGPAPSSPVTPGAPVIASSVKPSPVPNTTPIAVTAPTPKVSIQQTPSPNQPKPAQGGHSQLDLKPVPSKPTSATGASTPGYGNVKQLVTFYDSQGKASVVRPYTYSQAVKQG